MSVKIHDSHLDSFADSTVSVTDNQKERFPATPDIASKGAAIYRNFGMKKC